MFSIKRALWALALVAAIVVLTPGLGFCVEEDLYIYRLLYGSVYFEYETGSTEENGRTSDHSSFQQTYTLDTLGNILSRRLITYDAGVAYTLNDYEQDQSQINSEQVNYYLKTTLLPKSNIPLSFYGNRFNDTITTAASDTIERTRTIYGLNWLARFRTLPETRVQIERQNDVSTGSDTTNTMYNVNLNKSLGPTENSLYYSLATTTDNLKSGNDTESQSVNFRNQTNISRSTVLDLGISRGDSSHDNPATPDMTVNGLTIGLQSRPSIEFNQEHRYTYFNTSSGLSDVESGNYAGNMSYRFTDRLDSNLSLSVGETMTESPDRSETSSSLGMGFGLNYRLSKKLTLSESLSYTKIDTSAETPASPDRELLRALTSLNYNDNLSWAMLGASARIGYNKDKTTDELSGSGIENGASVALTSIDFNRYVLFNASADWNQVNNLTGDVWSENQSFQLSAFNKLWRRYVQLAANFSDTSQESWLVATDSSSRKWSFDAVSTYFRNTRIEFNTEHISAFDSVSGDSEVDSALLGVTHNRYFAGGTIDAGFTYNKLNSRFAGGTSEFTSTTFLARYDKKLLRTLSWLASATYSSGEGDNNSFKNTIGLSNLFTWQLRHWLVSAEQKYTFIEDQNRELTENSLLFRALRQFTWFL